MSDDAQPYAYTNRTIAPAEPVKAVGPKGSIDFGGHGYGGHHSLTVLQPGDELELEYLGTSVFGGQIVGARRPGGPWLYRKTDAELETERANMLAGFDRRRREMLEANREVWATREAALPDWLKERLVYFRERGGEKFELDGWGYELIICELAALYVADEIWLTAAMPIEDGWERLRVTDPPAVTMLAHREGTSGNQHMAAQSLAIGHARNPERSIRGTRSAMSPITGDPDYSHDA